MSFLASLMKKEGERVSFTVGYISQELGLDSKWSISGPLGLVGFVLAFVGTALFVVTGAITAYVMPVVARLDPSALEKAGAFFVSRPLAGVYLSSALLLPIGYGLLGIATCARGSSLARRR